MPNSLTDKILDHVSGIPRDIPFQLSPMKVNEPFLDKRLFDIIDRCASV